LAGKTYSHDNFCVEGFSLQGRDRIVELFIVMVLFCVFPTRNSFIFLALFQ